jgi:hypothetical protein
VAFSAARSSWAGFGGESLEAQQRAIAQARHDLGPERFDTLWTRVEAMSYDETVDYLHAELDRAIAST